jgi:hypothetical protein
MAKSNKLQNIKAIQQMIDGTHKFQTKQSTGFSDAKDVAKKAERHEVGDKWEETDANGTVWVIEQHEGFRSKKSKNSEVFAEVRDFLTSFPKCRKETCTCFTPNHLDEKMRRIQGMCFDCVIEMEHELKIQGKYDEYATNKMKENAKAWLRNAEQDVEMLKKAYTESSKIVINGEGETETWAAKMSPEEFDEKVQQNFEKFKQNLLDKIEGKTNETISNEN